MDYIARAITMDGFVRIYTAVTTELCNEAAKIHGCSATAAAALGRTLTATAMIGAMMKDEETSVTVQISGGGPIGKICAVTDGSALVRGYCINPYADLPTKKNGHLDVGGIVGTDGELGIIKDYGLKEPYVGHVSLATGEIGDDFTKYFAESEQTPSAVGLGVLVDKDLSVKSAGGFIIQLLPGAGEEHIEDIEKSIKALGSVTEAIEKGMTPEEMAESLMSDHPMFFYDNVETGYFCPCSEERMERALCSISKEDLKDIIETDGHAELKCHFCRRTFDFSKEHLIKLYER